MAGTHTRKSASGAKQWMECPGSLALIDLLRAMGVEPDEDSEDSRKGSAAHALGETCLKEGTEPWMHMGQVMEADGEVYDDFPVDAEMSQNIQMYTDYIRNMYSDGVEMLIEERIDNPDIAPDFGGTADCVVHRVKDGGGFVHVIDYKNGVHGVDVEGNPQLLYYAYGTLKKLGVQPGDGLNTGITIVQPRCFHEEDPIRERWLSSDDILEWGDGILLPAMERADKDGTLKLGEHCHFCPAKLICAKMQENFDDLAAGDPKKVKGFSDEELALRYEQIKPAEEMAAAIRKEAYTRAMKGGPVPGTKLVKGKSNRIFKDGAEEAAKEKFGDDAFNEPKAKSPAQIEKTCVGGKEFVAKWAFKPEPGLILVSSDDRRQAVKVEDGGKTFAGVGQ